MRGNRKKKRKRQNYNKGGRKERGERDKTTTKGAEKKEE